MAGHFVPGQTKLGVHRGNDEIENPEHLVLIVQGAVTQNVSFNPPEKGEVGVGPSKRLQFGFLAFQVRGLQTAGIVGRFVIVVRAFEDFPIVKALSAFGGDVIGAPVPVDMPFANVGGIVAVAGKGVG